MSKERKSIIAWIREKDLFKILCFGIAAFTITAMWLMFEFKDLDSLTAWSLNIWDVIFDKDLGLKDFYSYTSLNIHGVMHQYCQGNYLWLIPLSIWNFPMWVIVNLFDLTVIGNPYCILWSKLYFMGFHVGMAFVSYLISKKLGRQNWASMLLILAAPEILISAEYTGQDEVAYVFCLLLVVYYMLCDKWKWAYMLCVVSVSFCPIMILPVTALILYKEKSVIKIALYEGGLFIPLMLFEFAYRNDEIYQIMKGGYSLERVVEQMFPVSNVQTTMGLVPVSIVLCILVLFFAYTRKSFEGRELLYIVTAIVMIISFLMDNYFYRTFIYIPFLITAVALNSTMQNMNLFLLTLLTYCRAFWNLTVGVENNMNTLFVLKNSWITQICDYFGSDRYGFYTCRNLAVYIEQSVPAWAHWMVAAIAFASAILLMYCNYYKKEKSYELALDCRLSIFAYVLCMPMILVAFWLILI